LRPPELYRNKFGSIAADSSLPPDWLLLGHAFNRAESGIRRLQNERVTVIVRTTAQFFSTTAGAAKSQVQHQFCSFAGSRIYIELITWMWRLSLDLYLAAVFRCKIPLWTE